MRVGVLNWFVVKERGRCRKVLRWGVKNSLAKKFGDFLMIFSCEAK